MIYLFIIITLLSTLSIFKKVLKYFKHVGLYINFKKIKFLVTEVKYLKLIVIIKGVYINPKKVDIIIEW